MIRNTLSVIKVIVRLLLILPIVPIMLFREQIHNMRVTGKQFLAPIALMVVMPAYLAMAYIYVPIKHGDLIRGSNTWVFIIFLIVTIGLMYRATKQYMKNRKTSSEVSVGEEAEELAKRSNLSLLFVYIAYFFIVVIVMSIIQPNTEYMVYLIRGYGVALSVAMTTILVRGVINIRAQVTQEQEGEVIKQDHKLVYILKLSLICVVYFMFTYYAFHLADIATGTINTAFNAIESVSSNIFLAGFDYLYFSIVTFSTVGFGDIVPLATASRLLVVLEIVCTFSIVTLGIGLFSGSQE